MTDDEIVAQVSGEPDLSGNESEDEPDNCPTVSNASTYKAFGITADLRDNLTYSPFNLMIISSHISFIILI